MRIQTKLEPNGFSASLLRNARVQYPPDSWGRLDLRSRECLTHNIMYLKVSPYALFHPSLHFEFPSPALKSLGDRCMQKDIPRIAAEDKCSANKLYETLAQSKITFDEGELEELNTDETTDACLLGLSFGRDSLLSYGLAKEADMEPKLAMVQDVWDHEATEKYKLLRSFEKEHKEKVVVLLDYSDDLSSDRSINKPDSEGIVRANAMNGYAVLLVPFALQCKTRYIVFGNEQNFNNYYKDSEGHAVYPSYDQSSEWMQQQRTELLRFTNQQIEVCSLVEPLYNLAELKILFSRYPQLAKYQMSCDLTETKEKVRWCQKCPACVNTFLDMTAHGFDPASVGFTENLLGTKQRSLFSLFNPFPKSVYEKPVEVRDEQLYSFYLASRNGAKGALIEEFKKQYRSEAIEREDELHKKFMGIHQSNMPAPFRNKLKSIFKEELA
ncbi:MAG TPA: hypothetical protein VJH97_06445 [Candidatus Nanoarchaeia archaeon]|nr:hypothetical protein [Candidatus Nanoarchaeia archaeon]